MVALQRAAIDFGGLLPHPNGGVGPGHGHDDLPVVTAAFVLLQRGLLRPPPHIYDAFVNPPVDQDRDAWTKKVAKDNPAWEQFRLSSENAEDFFRAIGLETIPRFIIVGPDGSIIDADAPRPSDEVCSTTLLQAVAQ